MSLIRINFLPSIIPKLGKSKITLGRIFSSVPWISNYQVTTVIQWTEHFFYAYDCYVPMGYEY